MDTIDIELTTQEFNGYSFISKLKGFILEYNNVKYIISIHHNLPIKKILHNDIELTVIINSYWSEILILEYNLSLFSIYNKINISLPKNNTQLYFNNIELLVYNIVFINIPFKFPYIACKIKNEILIDQIIDILPSLSGSPVFNKKKKIIVLFSKFDKSNNTLLFIPIYIVIKNLTKNNNNNIYTISKSITKKTLYHYNLKLNLPIDIYFMLEGDDSQTLIINKHTLFYIIDTNFNATKSNNFRILNMLNKILPKDEFFQIIKQFNLIV